MNCTCWKQRKQCCDDEYCPDLVNSRETVAEAQKRRSWTPEELVRWSDQATRMYLHAREQEWAEWFTEKKKYWRKRREFWLDRMWELRRIEKQI